MSAETAYVGVHIRGGLVPWDLVTRVSTGASGLAGVRPGDYGLATGETIREAANRIWPYLLTAWSGYRKSLGELSGAKRSTTLTRERWLQILLDQLGYGRVPLTSSGGIAVDDKAFPVSHQWETVPIHLLGEGVDLDHRTPGLAGAAGQAPQSMVQQLLNRSDSHLWAILSNGTSLRLLRDSTTLVGPAYLEFDVQAIFDGELFSDFLVLFMFCHASRLAVRDPEIGPESCWLELWRAAAVEEGSRALDQLRDGVVEALQILGSGFLSHRDNADLRQRVESGDLGLADYNHALLRIVYRLLFCFVAEDRDALLSPEATTQARQRYAQYFSTSVLRRVARRRRGGRHGDRWQAIQVVWDGLGADAGRPEIGIAGIGGLFERGELDFLRSARLSNEALLTAVRALSVVEERRSGQLRIVNYRDLGAEELGSIYEALLEYVPRWDPARREYSLGVAAGNARKTTGSYYTPTSLIESLLDTALDPVLDDAEKKGANDGDVETSLLSVTVCDPACGSGHFLVAAARRIAKRLASARAGDPEPPDDHVRSALREVVAQCIYGVDINPLAAELAKVSLWLEGMERGRPLAFLDGQIKVGNALVGATPSALENGLPQSAFKPIEGDDKTIAAQLAKQNKREAGGQGVLFGSDDARVSNAALAERARLFARPALSLADAHVQQQRLRQYVDSPAYRQAKVHADAWCAAFVWPKISSSTACPTNAVLDEIRFEPDRWLGDDAGDHARAVVGEVDRLAAEHRFFHWHLEFPHLFPTERSGDGSINDATGWYGGFTVILGNPPWERVKLQEKEFFASRDEEIAQAPNAAARGRLIRRLKDENPGLYASFMAAKRRAEGDSHLLRDSGRYPLTGRGDVNTYAVFAELDRHLTGAEGRTGVILPTGIATDATTQHYFRDLVETGALASLYDFENRKPLFEGVDSRTKFCLLTLAGRDRREPAADFAFFAHDPADLHRPDVRFALTPEEIKLLNPNTGTCPVFRSRRDAEITLGIYKRVPVLIDENDPVNGNPWGIKFMTMFHMSNDSHLFHTREELEDDGWVLNGNVFERPISNGGVTVERMMPLYEAKMIHHYDTKWATYQEDGTVRDVTPEEKRDPDFHVMPRYWLHEDEIDEKLDGKWNKSWLLGWRDICRSTDTRTVIAAQCPRAAYGDKWLLALPSRGRQEVQAAWSSFVFDFAARQKIGGTSMKYFTFRQLPMPAPGSLESRREWIAERVDRLNAQSLDGATAERLRAELDALMLHVYGVSREDADYILETFPIVRRKDVAVHGEYRTKRLVLEAYDELSGAAL